MPTFRKHEHLLTPGQFQAVYDCRQSVSDSGMIIYARENCLAYTRVGFSVSKKYGGAVQRNRLRRLYREALRLTKDVIPTGLDLVLIPRTRQDLALEELRKSLVRLIKKAHKKLEKDKTKPATAEPGASATGATE